jgi:hypothetical protein
VRLSIKRGTETVHRNMTRPSKILSALSAIVAALALTACNTSDPTMGVGKADSPANTIASSAAAGTTPSGVALSNAADVAKASMRIYVAPIIGSTVAAITPLSRRLAAIAPANGVALVGAADATQDFIIKAYFSAFDEGGNTTLVFVWDVFDKSGTRQHRVQGQESVPGASAGDAWAIVPPAVMERVADRFIADFLAWRGIAVPAAPAVAATVAPAASAAITNANAPLPPAPTPTPTPTPTPAPSTGG